MKTIILSVCSRLCIISLASLGATAAFAQTPVPNDNMAPAIKHADKSFVEDAVKAGREEVAISQIAADRSMNPQVKEFAQMIVNDHNGVNTELASLASTKGVMLTTKSPNVDKWAKKSAKSFDEDYIDQMISAHKDALDLFEKEAKKGTDPELTALAGKTIAALQGHLSRAEDIKKMLK